MCFEALSKHIFKTIHKSSIILQLYTYMYGHNNISCEIYEFPVGNTCAPSFSHV